MNHRLHEAIMLNNEGAWLLMSGNTLEALRMLSRAGRVLLRNANHGEGNKNKIDPSTLLWQEQYGSYNENGENAVPDSSSVAPSTTTTPWCPSSSSSSSSTTTSGQFFVCTRPLIFPTTTLYSVDEISMTMAEMNTMVDTVRLYIIFNLALGCHHFGIVSGKDAPLRRAMELYHVVLLNNTAVTTTRNRSVVMECIVLNNLCHIHIEWCQYDVCPYYMQCMQDAMIDILSSSGGHQHCHVHKENNISECCCTTRTTPHHHLTPHEVWEMILNGFFHHHHTPPPTAQAA